MGSTILEIREHSENAVVWLTPSVYGGAFVAVVIWYWLLTTTLVFRVQ